MFSLGSSRLFESLLALPDMPPVRMRRVLSKAYAEVLTLRTNSDLRSQDDLSRVLGTLDDLINVFETHVIVNPDLSEEIQEASAFVAAEAAYLSGRLSLQLGLDADTSSTALWPASVHSGVRAGLLYMLSHHYSNAARTADTLLAEVPQRAVDVEDGAALEFFRTIRAYLQLEIGYRREPNVDREPSTGAPSEVRTRTSVAIVLSSILEEHMMWLGGLDTASPDERAERLTSLESLLATTRRYGELLGLARLFRLTLERTHPRALREQGWDADDPTHSSYLDARCADRPLVWPPAYEYAGLCFPGPVGNAVVSVPTGAGKGFLAEIALAQMLGRGWAIYLVPTNALASQVRQSLSRVFDFTEDIEIQAFLGGQEYTLLPTEHVHEVEAGTVVVMTPEKCAAALRQHPDAFRNLRLLIFDECHLIGDGGTRGALAELVVSHIAALAEDISMVFTSALLKNAQEMAAWLESITERETFTIAGRWKPTRTMRGVIALKREGFNVIAEDAKDNLESLSDWRKNYDLDAPYRAVVSLQGTWESQDEDDYALIDPPLLETLQLSRSRASQAGEWSYELNWPGWINNASASWSSFLANRGERVLSFLPASRHHPFVVGDQTTLDSDVFSAPADDSRIVAHLTCAEYELGTTSQVGQLLQSGVAVHSSAILDAERHATEEAFGRGLARVMYATGTLAQGLNLPATAVIVGGTTIGRPTPTQAETSQRVRAQLLNAIGRAGRASYENHGTALVIPNKPFLVGTRAQGQERGRRNASFLRHEDASISVSSALVPFMRRVRRQDLTIEALAPEEMTAFTYAPRSEHGEDAGRVFARTLAVWSIERDLNQELGDLAAAEIERLGRRFFQSAGIPEWVRDVASQVGLPLPALFALHNSSTRRDLSEDDVSTIDGWLRRLLVLLAMSDAHTTATLLWGTELLGGRIRPPRGWQFEALAGTQPNQGDRRRAWRSLYETLSAYLTGKSISEIAAVGLGLDDDPEAIDYVRSTGGKPLPKTIRLLNDLGQRLSLLSGGLVAMHHMGAQEAATPDTWSLDDEASRTLSYLPLAIRSGCGDLSSLSWYRFGISYRRPAHLMGRLHPVPSTLTDDSEIRDWIRARRREALGTARVPLVGHDVTNQEHSVVDALRTIVGVE